jgi:hypothetical protein
VSGIAQSMTQVLQQLRVGLGQAGFEQRRQLVELLIDRVVVTDGQVEIRYVIPTTPGSTRTRFCHLRTDYFPTTSHTHSPGPRCYRPYRSLVLGSAGSSNGTPRSDRSFWTSSRCSRT